MKRGKETAGAWLLDIGEAQQGALVNGLVLVTGFDKVECKYLKSWQ
ncbi:MAG: hypothetical protein IPL77_16825 [Flavobacteriales bacterium]|nr:hypothetical protein [Flavobacteriales bacterium]